MLKKKKVLFLSQDFNIGGSQLLLKNVVDYLNHNKTFSCDVWSPLTGELKYEYDKMSINVDIKDFKVDEINRNECFSISKKTHNKILKLIEECKVKKQKLAIRCAGTITTYILDRYDFSGVQITGIYDSSKVLAGQSIKGYNIYPVEELEKHTPDVVLIAHPKSHFFKKELKSFSGKILGDYFSEKPFQKWMNSCKYFCNMLAPLFYVNQKNPDILFLNNARTFWAVLVAKILRKKVIWAIHENFEPETFKVFPQFLYLWALKKADCCIFPSKYTYEVYKRYVNNKTQVVIYNGVDIEQINLFKQENCQSKLRMDLGLPENASIISVIGTVYPVKDQLSFVNAAVNILKSTGNKNLQFLIIGCVDNNYSKQLQTLIDASDCSDFIRLIPVTSNIYNYFLVTDLVVCSSITESFGIAIIEAMAFQKPVIAPDVGGIPEVIDHEENGLLISPENKVKNLETQIINLLEDKSLQNKLIKNAYTKLLEHFNLESTCQKYEQTIQKIIN